MVFKMGGRYSVISIEKRPRAGLPLSNDTARGFPHLPPNPLWKPLSFLFSRYCSKAARDLIGPLATICFQS